MNVGRSWPRATYADFGQSPTLTYRCPPRKMGFSCTNVNLVGDLATAWSGISSKSDVCERASGPRLQWIIPHPSLSGYEIRVYWSIVGPLSGFAGLSIQIDAEYWAEGAKQGDLTYDILVDHSNNWPNPESGGRPYVFRFANNWAHRLHPTRLVSMNNFSIYGLNWADDPSYQPYRTRP